MSFNCSHISLVERKKQQWAKEREELASLCAPWSHLQGHQAERTVPKISMKHSSSKNFPIRMEYKDDKRSSLPPLYKNQYISYDRYDKEKELSGETSGYGSDNNGNHNQSGYESSSSRDDRPRWGDKGVKVGKCWQPRKESFKNPSVEPPNWVKRGLKAGEIIVSNTSPSESPEQRYEEAERPYTGCSYSVQRSTYIRGQNIPIDALELAERERRRQAALAHQGDVRQQLEERERRKKEERDRKIKEEYEEELRIEREQVLERERKLEELRLLQEKQERERKRNEAIKEAINLAQKEALLEKKNKLKHIKNDVISENILRKEKVQSEEEKNSFSDVEVWNKNSFQDSNYHLNNTKTIYSKNEVLTNEINHNLEIRGRSVKSPKPPKNNFIDNKPPTSVPSTECQSLTNQNGTDNINILQTPFSTSKVDSLALVIQPSLEALQSVQYALFVPATPQSISLAVSTIIPQTDNTARTKNRILTPTQYRNKNRNTCESATQTEDFDFRSEFLESRETYLRERLKNIHVRSSRKERRTKSESMEERPKWGANVPPTRYLKQSEKDPLYQRRKLRQKINSKEYDDKNSSDESQTATPRTYNKKGYFEKRQTRGLLKKNDQVFSRNIMFQTEILPLESDKDQIYYKKQDCCCVCSGRIKCGERNVKVDILKIEHNSPRDVLYKTEMLDRSEVPSDFNDSNINNEILEKLTSLHNGLLLKQQDQWENITSSNSPHSLSRH